ncbi:MAG: cytochrome c family protein [Myxococcales bacterium]|nr:MAG: cytochrome c family protein [Myxococcales bacterium]
MKSRAPLLMLGMLLAAVVGWFGSSTARAEGGRAPASSAAVRLPAVVAQSVRPPGSSPDDDGPSPVVFPEQTLPLRFNHQKHVQGLGVSCTTCHAGAKTSQKAADLLLPPATRCDGCHGTNHRNKSAVTTDEPRPLGQCAYCHNGYDAKRPLLVARVLVPKPNLKFSHQKHVVGARMACASCHGKVEAVTLATRDQLPRMKQCVSCHVLGSSEAGNVRATTGAKRGRPSGACPTCHLTEPSGLLTTTFASGKMLPPPWLNDAGHGYDFIERHKRVAGDDSKFCASCHQERFCVGCHDGNVRPRKIHPNDFLSQHAMAARQNNPRCTSCHQQQSFCLTCHQRAGVAMSGPVGNFENRGRFHPPQSIWTEGARGPSHHAWEAERNLNACVSCHQERDCAMCHATRSAGGRGPNLGGMGQGLNPHPVGFAGRCQEALRQNARPCLTCHVPSDPELLKCR